MSHRSSGTGTHRSLTLRGRNSVAMRRPRMHGGSHRRALENQRDQGDDYQAGLFHLATLAEILARASFF